MLRKNADIKIKKYIKPGLFMRLLPILIVMSIYTVWAGYIDGGKFNIENFLYTLIILFLSTIFLLKFHFRTILLKADLLVYSGLSRRIKIKYKDIKKFCFLQNSGDEKKTYSLILITEKANWKISNIEQYRKQDIILLIEMIKNKNSTVIYDSNISVSIDEILWLESYNT